MSSKFVLRIRCVNATAAKNLAAVLAPDNKAIPSEQRLSMSVARSVVTLRIESVRARSGFNTVRIVLRDVALFREIWLISRGKGA